ncbi:hypothetical protein GWI33_007011 [Rhynchophorus ferrugineus]|uniref:Uncharacterized protein n=1 Tax=Rhynchophorus ferrugineus TaxID=354439 RepID=A0A834IE60_RHYFE|nr:hypothetical protein GWI33_007011 [Rhynchophorus ferrugineus]
MVNNRTKENRYGMESHEPNPAEYQNKSANSYQKQEIGWWSVAVRRTGLHSHSRQSRPTRFVRVATGLRGKESESEKLASRLSDTSNARFGG